jgi:hypothetical protein
MNALAHCALLLSSLANAGSSEWEELRAEARRLYERLERVDSDRAQRYKDMATGH